MALIRKILTFLAFMAAVVLAAPSMPATSVEKTQKVLQAKSKTSKSAKKAKKSKKKKKKKEQAEQVVETAEEESAAESSTEAVEDNAEEQTAEAEVPQEEQSDLESAFEEVQSSAAPEQAPTPPAESALQPVAEPTPQPEAKPAAQPVPQPAAQPATQASAQPAAKATTVNPAVLNTKPGQQTFILRGSPTQATTAAVADTSASSSADSVDTPKRSYVNRFKAMRKKKSVAEYDSTQNAIRDSIASITYNFGLSFIGGRAKDKRLGNLEENSDWDGNFGVYLFYRYYFTSFFALQGRLGAIYRYARFTKNDEIKDGITYKETQFDVNNKLTVDYHDIAVDAPLTLKLGAHTGHTTFIFLSLAGDITKSIFDQINTTREYTVKHPSKELKKDLAVLESKGLYPAYENYTVEGNFYADDWEFSSWAGAGIDCKYISVEYQVLLAAGSTKDNHRFHAINHGGMPSWRVMVDLSLK